MNSIPPFSRKEASEYVSKAFERVTSLMGTPYTITSSYIPYPQYSYFPDSFFFPRYVSPISLNFPGNRNFACSHTFSSIPSFSSSSSSTTPSSDSSKKKKKEEPFSRVLIAAFVIALTTAGILIGKSVYSSVATRKEAMQESLRMKNLLATGELDHLFTSKESKDTFEDFVDANLKIDQIRYSRFTSGVKTALGLGMGAAALTYGFYTDNAYSEKISNAGEITTVASLIYGAWKVISHFDDSYTLNELYRKVAGSQTGNRYDLGKGLAKQAHDAITPRFSFTSIQEANSSVDRSSSHHA